MRGLEGSRPRVHFVWDLWYACNYRCTYCWFDGQWEDLAKKHLVLPPKEWLECWERVYNRYGGADIIIVGGEPLLYPGSLELFSGMARWHTLCITTNLSVPREYLEAFIRRVPPGNSWTASFHPEFTPWEDFSRKVAFLKDQGRAPRINLVAYPPFLKQVFEKRDYFLREGVEAVVLVFTGKYRGREYPASYTAEERAMLSEALAGETVEYGLNGRQTRGQLCGTGYVHAGIKANGDVYRCSQTYETLLGNLRDPDLRLHDAPQPCPVEHCNASCDEYRFLWSLWSRKNATEPVRAAVAGSGK